MGYKPDLIMDEAKIGKYLSGEANPEDAMSLEEWIAASPENRGFFEQSLKIWNTANKNNSYQVPDKSKAWEQLETNLPGLNKNAVSSPVKNLFKKYSIAASILGILLISAPALYRYLKLSDKIASTEITFATTDTIERKILPDSSEVVLNNNSVLRFPKKFTPKNRQVYLQGEAYFAVTPHPSQPFIIAIDGIYVQVVGTSFNLKNNTERGTIETQVNTGKVKMFHSQQQIFVTAGQTGIYNKKNNSFAIEDTLLINKFGYATRNFDFIDEKLTAIIRYLEKAYSKQIVLDNPKLGNCKMTSSFENKSIEYVLEVIAATLNLTYNMANGVIHIGGNHEGC